MSCTFLPKAAKPVWASQMTQLPCLVVEMSRFDLYVILQVKLEVSFCCPPKVPTYYMDGVLRRHLMNV